MAENFDEYPDRIAQTFANKTILLTGGTGFVGKVLLEKLLRSCPAVGKVYVLVRSKKEKEPHLRLKDVFKDPIFDSLKKQQDLEIFSKVEAVSGDVSAPNLSLSHYDRGRICAEVEIIYHCAALVRFDIPLKDAVFTNVRGTKLMLELAKNCTKLLIFTHVSTAYCHLDQKVLHERTYPPPTDPDGIIKMCECMDEDIVESIKNKLLDQFPNCYPFTKALSEGLVSREMEALPVVIVRPSVVVPIWREPMPGYTDNINGPTGLLMGAAKGVVRSMYCKGDGYLDYIPADIVANGLLFTTYDYLTHKGERRVYNAVSSKDYQITFNEVIEMGKSVVETDLPFNMILWYPGGSLTQSRLKHFVSVILFQLFPALFVDCLLIFLRQKPFLMKVQKRILSAYKLCEYYVNRNWDFNNDNTLKAIQKLNPRERRTYKLDGTGGNFREYFTNCVHSARLYLVKEADDQIPAAKRQMKVMWFVDWLFKILMAAALAYFIWKKMY